MGSLFDDFRDGLQEAISFAKGEGQAKIIHLETDAHYPDVNPLPNKLEGNLDTPEKAAEIDELMLKTGIPIAEILNGYGISPEDLDGWEDVMLEGDLPYNGNETDWGEDVGGEILPPYE